mmetsp:Transcript_338/g.845  ORF Transcript_338/g.845 Transcript_338/m.845 type:complete len:229 (-) Transcript_338:22-708(-)
MHILALALDWRQVDPRTMGRPRFGRLRESLEGVLRADPLEVVEVQVEETPVVHADSVHKNGNTAHTHDWPGVSLAVAVRSFPDDKYSLGRLQLEAAGLGNITAKVHMHVGETRHARQVRDYGTTEISGQFPLEATLLDLGEHDQDVVAPGNPSLPISSKCLLLRHRRYRRGQTGDGKTECLAKGKHRPAGRARCPRPPARARRGGHALSTCGEAELHTRSEDLSRRMP